jgi:hypothetical protein
MNKTDIRYTEYYSPGRVIADTWLENGSGFDWPKNAYAYQVWEHSEIRYGGVVYRSEPRRCGKLIYHPDSRITTYEELQAGKTGLDVGSALLHNMKCNEWSAVIWTRWGTFPQPWDPETMEIEEP